MADAIDDVVVAFLQRRRHLPAMARGEIQTQKWMTTPQLRVSSVKDDVDVYPVLKVFKVLEVRISNIPYSVS